MVGKLLYSCMIRSTGRGREVSQRSSGGLFSSFHACSCWQICRIAGV